MKLNRSALIVPILLETRRPRLIFDQDDVLFDLLGGLVEVLNKKYGKNYTVEQCKGWNIAKYFGKEALEVFKDPNFYSELKPKKDAVEVIERMYNSNKYDIRIVSAASTIICEAKIFSINKHMPFIDTKFFIPCSDKSSIWGDILIDDGIHNLNEFSQIGEGLVYDMPHNRNTDKYPRIFCLKDAEDYIENLFYPEDLKLASGK